MKFASVLSLVMAVSADAPQTTELWADNVHADIEGYMFHTLKGDKSKYCIQFENPHYKPKFDEKVINIIKGLATSQKATVHNGKCPHTVRVMNMPPSADGLGIRITAWKL